MSHQNLFPGFVSDAESRQLINAGLKDNSWGNDAVPFFGLPGDDEGNLQLGIDHPVDGEREHPGGPRIFIVGPPDSPDLLWQGEDLAQGIAEFQRIAAIPREKVSWLETRFILKWKLAPGQSEEQFIETSQALAAVYTALDVIQKAHPELVDFNFEATHPVRTTASHPDTGATMIAATRLLADLGASFEHPGYISITKDGIEFAIGDINGPFGNDYGPADQPGAMRSSYNEALPETATPEELAAYARRVIAAVIADR